MGRVRQRVGGYIGDEAHPLGKGDDVAHLGRLYPTRIGAVVVQRPVGSRAVMVRSVATKNPHEVLFAENDDVVEALSAD